MKICGFLALCVVVLLLPGVAYGQSTNAAITGRVADPSKAVIAGAKVTAINSGTNVRYEGATNDTGSYLIVALPPGTYRIEVEKLGFKTIVQQGVVLHVQDTIELNFEMALGSASETITVTGGAPLVNTENATVSTVVDRNFAENLPLNGRSFQSLIELAPGVVVTPTSGYDFGQFSVNGQRATSNYWMVDGVSANIGTSGQAFEGSAAGGAVGSFSALGGTNGLVSVDAMQEFRIQTSTFAPEFGRTPGGQISIATRSGTNQFHGALFDYFRNDVIDANDWFANHAGLPKPAERQNDFGGTFAGPLLKNKTFFFLSYEGLRLRLPHVALTTVPDLNARATANSAVQPFLNAYPKPNGTDNLTTGVAQFNAGFSNRASLDAYSIRIDHRISSKFTIFGRYNNSPSELVQRGPDVRPLNTLFAVNINTQTATVGTTWTIAPTLVNDLRFNYSRVTGSSGWSLDTFGGAVVPPVSGLLPSPFTTQNSAVVFGILGLSHPFWSDGNNAANQQQQVNLTDNLSILKGAHTVKVGIDYRRLFPTVGVHNYSQLALFLNVTAAESGNLLLSVIGAGQSGTVLFQNFAVFAQDTWRIKPRFTMTYGLRWDVDVSPSTTSGPALQSVTGYNLSDLTGLAIAPEGTPVYRTPYGNLAPRLGIAYQIHQNPNWQTVVRGGFGVFFDLVSPEIGSGLGATFPFSVNKVGFGGSFPLSAAAAAPPPLTIDSFSLGGTQAVVFDPNMKLPYTLQWNVAIEQGLGNQQIVSASYVGSAGRRLAQSALITSPNPNFLGSVDLVGNTATSDYHALQVQFQRRLSRGLQALAAYTWSQSIDDASIGSYSGGGLSSNTLVPGINPRLNRGPSDFDIRHTFITGITYAIPVPRGNAFTNTILKGWSVESFVLARSAPPVNVFDSGAGFALLGARTQIRPNLVPGQPLYLTGSQYPGNKAINPNAFVDPPAGQQGNVGRNALRGFGATQWDFAVHRDFPIHESLRLQFRAEMFNVLNHPNFGPPVSDMSNTSQFGQATQMLGASLDQGSGGAGLNALHQIGGPRSIQFALRLSF